ncbi:hypothetical protein NDU88_007501 [Pleurodeles waltl]|uniref:Uncharacterized protein n=1 Tax=Pleurodeles waltl TaxID=8319 RepID=A0AAV7RV91_PLEWA|nr:hypothetical protein NDU88_007501 [Pleurodeles waltl]
MPVGAGGGRAVNRGAGQRSERWVRLCACRGLEAGRRHMTGADPMRPGREFRRRPTGWTITRWQDGWEILGSQEVTEGCVDGGTEQDPPREPFLNEIIAAIHDLKGSLTPLLDAVAEDVGLLRANLQKDSDKVSTAETDIACLQSTPKTLEEKVRFLTMEQERMVAPGGPGRMGEEE